jgi:PilZ domain
MPPISEKRRTERLSIKVPISVTGEDTSGRHFEEQTTVRDVSRLGGRVLLKGIPQDGTRLVIANLATGVKGTFRTTGSYPVGTGGLREWGVQQVDNEANVWDVLFEEVTEPGLDSGASALLVCTTCGQRVFARLRRSEYRMLELKFVIRRPCDRCDTVTDWVVGICEDDDDDSPPTAVKASERNPLQAAKPMPQSAGAERRRSPRFALKVPLLVSSPGGPSDLTVAEDVSRSGLRFASSVEAMPGSRLQVIIGYGVADSPPVHAYRIVWRNPMHKSARYMYGVTQVDLQNPPANQGNP